jgi:hypothetical protein
MFHIAERIATLLERDETWYEQRLPIVEDRIRDRSGELSGRLGDADWLDGAEEIKELPPSQDFFQINSFGAGDGA